MRKIIVIAFVLRIIVALLGEHGDVVNYYWWSRDLLSNGLGGFYDRNIANAMRPTYPPVTSYLFFLSANLHELVWHVFWFLNTHIKLFPSNLIFWLESDRGWYIFNKLPAIFADLGIIWLVYLIAKDLKNKKMGKITAAFFAFNPVFWYNSSLWGQTDSVFALPMLAAFYVLYKGRIKLSAFLYGLAILTKPTAFFAFPVFAFWFIKKSKPKEILFLLIIFLVEVVLLYFPFHPINLISWVATFYQRSLGGELGYMVANAFNFWALFFGFDNRPDTSLFLGIPSNVIGNFIYIFSLFLVGSYFLKKKKIGFENVLILAGIVSFTAFLFLPRMHERYFYPALILLTPVAFSSKKLEGIYIGLSVVHLINLYHFWWVPRIDFLMRIFSYPIIEKMLIIINILIFIFLVNTFRKHVYKT